ncbi:MAG: putative coenzyme PQQ synthesis protein E PqqE [Phycisphaerae bacterium]
MVEPDGRSSRALLLQWHITDRCNLRCAHCYQESRSDGGLTLPELLSILEQYKALLGLWRGQTKRPVRGHVTLTGGEPFVREDLWNLLEILSACRPLLSFALLTNGTLIDGVIARRLRKLRPAFVQVSIEGSPTIHDAVQVSIEGSPTIHDAIRGSGSFDRAVRGLEHLTAAGVRTLISFTASRLNYREFPEVARLGRRLGVSRVWADRLVPYGAGAALRDQMLTPEQTREFVQIMRDAQNQTVLRWFRRRHTEIAMHRALQFLAGGGVPYRCTAGDKLIAIQPDGDVYPCRRMPIRVGNVMETPLASLYSDSPVLRALRDRCRTPDGCGGCLYARTCQGGLRCLSYALTGDLFSSDPGCWISRPRKPATPATLTSPAPCST